MAIADEIKRLTVENQTLHDTLSHQNVEYILENCASGVRAELETYETIMEGLKKVKKCKMHNQSIFFFFFVFCGKRFFNFRNFFVIFSFMNTARGVPTGRGYADTVLGGSEGERRGGASS